MRALIVVALLLTGCGGDGRFDDADTCAELSAMFDAMPVSDDAAERKAVGDEYRERFRQLDCNY